MIASLGMLLPSRFPAGKRLLAAVAVIATYTAIITWVEKRYHPGPLSDWDWGLSAVNALILGSLVTFRTNEAKRRWWEGRTLWGQLVNDIRNLSLKAKHLANLSVSDRQRFSVLLIAFANGLRQHLRGGAPLQSLPGFAHDTAEPKHVPLYLAGLIQEETARWRREEKLDDVEMWMFDPHVRDLMNVCGGCEKIRNTPVPLSYRALIHRGITLNVLVTPIFLAQDAGYWAILIMAVTTYFTFGVEATAVHIEEPFGLDGDDLPLDAICRTIEDSVKEVLVHPSAEQLAIG